MAFRNAAGKAISFACGDLIRELQADIVEFGGNLLVDVVTEMVEGVTIYKDYNFIGDDAETAFDLSPTERMQRMTASALLVLYEEENKIF